MKKKFLSSILALTMVLVAMTPVMALDSPTNKGTEVKKDTETVNGTEITIGGSDVANFNATDKAVIKVQAETTETKTAAATYKNATSVESLLSEKGSSAALSTAKSVLGDLSKAEDAGSFDVSANDFAKEKLNGSAVKITVKAPAVSASDKVVALHFKSDGQIEVLPCTVNSDGSVTFSVSSFSAVILVKVASTSGGSSNSGSKVVTCEEANGKGWVWSEAKKACVYSVTNTSTK